MKLFLDTLDEAALPGLWGLGAFAGITTNPILLACAGVTVEQAVARCRALGVGRIFLQAAGDDREAIACDAVRLADMWRRSAKPVRAAARKGAKAAAAKTAGRAAAGRGARRAAGGVGEADVWIKIPAFDEGYAAMARLRAEGIATAATAVLSAGQALIAVEAGADVVIPFLGRAEASGIDSAGLVQDVAWIAADAGRRVLAASVKTEAHVRMALHAGCWAATLPPDLARTLGRNDAARTAIDAFRRTGGSEGE